VTSFYKKEEINVGQAKEIAKNISLFRISLGIIITIVLRKIT